MKLKKGDSCPSCKKGKLDGDDFLGKEIIFCKKCGFDNTDPAFEVHGEGRNTQSEKGRYSPYRAGGGKGKR